jgi:hypothetical protein
MRGGFVACLGDHGGRIERVAEGRGCRGGRDRRRRSAAARPSKGGPDRDIDEFRRSGAKRKEHFELAAAALSSRVRRMPCSVYDLDPAIHGVFDFVFCGTLLIHLRDPVRALERIAAVCAGELMLLETVDARLDLSRPATPCARFEPAPRASRRRARRC